MHADFGGRLDYLTDEMCQMDTRIGHIAHQRACIGSYGPFPSPSLKATLDHKDDVDFSGDDEMTTSR